MLGQENFGPMRQRGKQAVIRSEDVKEAGKQHTAEAKAKKPPYTVRMLSLTGQYMQVHFNDEHIAHNVDQKHLDALLAQFGPNQVEVLD